jgi:hypothetical protein
MNGLFLPINELFRRREDFSRFYFIPNRFFESLIFATEHSKINQEFSCKHLGLTGTNFTFIRWIAVS